MVVNPIIAEQPRNICINDIDTPWKIKFTVEIFVDNLKAEIPTNIGLTEECKRTIYTTSNDGTVFVEWKEDPNFEIGQFLWIFEVPLRDMDDSKSSVYVNGKETPHYTKHSIQDGYHYKIELVSKNYMTPQRIGTFYLLKTDYSFLVWLNSTRIQI